MWVLETDGDIFQGKRLWLRPGKRFLFGRTRSADDDFVVSDKTISRNHLLVEVDEVLPEECGNQRSRSKVTLTDQATKIGTTLNGEQIRNEKDNKIGHVLQKDVNVITIGRYPHELRIVWVPITFTFSFTTKEQKANPYTRLYELLGPLDIKVRHDYEAGVTTHLAARKRNTAKGLQALIDGKVIVNNETYIQALVKAATSNYGPSPLEVDFEANFPDPAEYLPPRGDEPTSRDASAYAPNPNRKDMFEGYTFIFYERRQCDNLRAPITLGGGKALLREAIPGETEVLDFVRYVKNVAGEKGMGEFEDGSEGKGVVVVRFNPVKGEGTEWFKEFTQQVSIRLDHRFVEQNEFLDAILGNDASVLRRPLEEPDATGVVAPQPSATTFRSTQTLQNSEQAAAPIAAPADASAPNMAPPEQQKPTRGRSRRTAASRFKGFDDDDDDDDFSIPVSSVPDAMDIDLAPAPSIEAESQGLFVSQAQSQGMFVTQQSQPRDLSQDLEALIEQNSPTPPPGRGSRKRAAPSDADDPFIDKMAPAAAAMKKRRLADETARRRRGVASPPPKLDFKKEPVDIFDPPKTKRKVKPDVDVMEAARATREKAEKSAREERDALERGLEGMDISEIRKLVKVEGMQIGRTIAPPQGAARADESERWDDKWNGRKNFKKFKRRGGEGDELQRRRTIVRLEEAKKRDYGIGEDYWLEDVDKDKDSQRKKKKGKGREMDDTSQSQSQPKGKSRDKRAAERAASILASEVDEEVVAVGEEEEAHVQSSSEVEIVAQPQARKAAAAKSQSVSQRVTKSQTLADKTNKTKNLPAASSNKRAAATTLTKPAPAKKAKQTIIAKEDSDEDSDEDGLAFKFKRK